MALVDSPFSKPSGRSVVGPIHHRTADICAFYFNRATEETRFTIVDFVELLANDYWESTHEDFRDLPLQAVDRSRPYKEVSTAIDNMVKTVQRWINPSHRMHFPLNVAKFWARQLPQPYSDQCRHALVREFGCLGVDAIDMTAAPDELRAAAEAMSHFSDLLHRMSQMMADGHLGPEDIDIAPMAISAGQEAASSALAIVALIQEQVVEPAQAVKRVTTLLAGSR